MKPIVELWRGASLFDRAPIRVVSTGDDGSSANPKTGAMVQISILPAAMHPVEAIRSGCDSSVCGSCPMRRSATGRACYVAIPHGIMGRAGSPERDRVLRLFPQSRAPLRIGTYGDPAAVPTYVWQSITSGRAWTSYTHSWRDAPELRSICMASVDSPGERALAKAQGWRTFRSRLPEETLLPGEINCPASSGLTQCAQCLLCSGTSRIAKDISIVAHGKGISAYRRMRQAS